MKKIDIGQGKKTNNTLFFDLSGNHSIVKVTAKIITEENNLKFSIRYAQNAVVEDLVLFDETIVSESCEVCFESEVPFEASHMCIITEGGNAEISDVCVFEEQDIESADCYPKYFDFDLGKNYLLDTLSIFTSSQGYVHYSLFAGVSNQKFDFVAEKLSDEKCNFETGDVYELKGKEARFIRVYIEYNSASAGAGECSIKFTGKESASTEILNSDIDIPLFSESEYNVVTTDEDAYNEIFGIIERRIGREYKSRFMFELCENPKENSLDFFEISDSDDKILIKGNTGVSIATGLNYYLKYYCKVNISQLGDQIRMPEKNVMVGETVFKETKAKIRYAYNYCTLSYTMAFWGEKEWRDELDWLALNGVNVVLDTTAQEEVWRRFLSKIGYSHEEIKRYIAGPAFYAWVYMANMTGFGGPVHDNWFKERTNLARKNHLIMRKLGMMPVLQGYSGQVPVDLKEYDENIEVINQGNWCSFRRPDMLRTTSESFKKYAKMFYDAQKEVYGEYSKFFATDPFHEGGNVSDMSLNDISSTVLSEMIKANPDSVWIIQSWQSNPKTGLLNGLDLVENGKEHALILDLYAEKTPHHNDGSSGNPHYGNDKEFDRTPWIYCMLNNFGGRLGLHGHLDNLVRNIPVAFNECDRIQGIGITPEEKMNNPVLYDFFFECVWQDNAQADMKKINIDDWLKEYTLRRYGAKSESVYKAWMILKETVYKAKYNMLGQGAPECVFNARPAFEIKAASTWGNAIVSYDKKELEEALRLFAEDYHKLKSSEGYIYDLVTIIQQVLSNKSQDIHEKMTDAFNKKDLESFKSYAKEFISLGNIMEEVTSNSRFYMLGRWINQAKALADSGDDFTKKLYEMDAKALITTWGAYNQSEIGGLHDYSNRQWSGLIGDFYIKRWEMWIDNRIKELRGEKFDKKINWFEYEWKWVRERKAYPTEPKKSDLSVIVKSIL